jgi:hypothetical protein
VGWVCEPAWRTHQNHHQISCTPRTLIVVVRWEARASRARLASSLASSRADLPPPLVRLGGMMMMMTMTMMTTTPTRMACYVGCRKMDKEVICVSTSV